MILQALTDYYEVMADKGKMPKQGWGPARVTFGLEINDDGQVIALHSLKTEQKVGKKTELRPQTTEVPLPQKRTVGVAANFICDNSGYLLGVDNKGKPERSLQCFEACATLHKAILGEVKTATAKAIVAFFDTWRPEQARTHEVLQPHWEELMEGGNLIFFHDLKSVMEDREIKQAWQTFYNKQGDDTGDNMQCLVTGQMSAIPNIHAAIKGVRGAQSSGASLISFNARAFESYDREQNLNSPIGHYAAFAYTTALNSLLADSDRRTTIGDTTVVCWAETGEEAYQDVGMMGMMGGMGRTAQEETEADLRRTLDLLVKGQVAEWDSTELSPHTPFYILGLSPNAARISVRFFLRDSFGQFLTNLQHHQNRLEITKPTYDKNETLTLWQTLQETVNQKSRDKAPSPQLAGDLLRSILTGARYPSTLLTGATLRIRAEQNVTRGRAAIIKAYYLKNPHPLCPKEVLTVSLNEESRNVPYTLGRLFSVLEAIQEKANPGINTTIKDKYFNSASSSPATIFPTLLNLAQKHLRKVDGGYKIFFDKQIQELVSVLDEHFPPRMTLPEQGAFQLGYYHQTQKRYEKKGD